MPKKKAYHHGDLKNALIRAGVEILSKEGVAGLTLRKVAQKAGVSHAAPYTHFADKQALIAAISSEGYRRLYESTSAVVARFEGDPAAQLVEGAWAYVQFALSDPDHFKVTLSSALEKEKDYPAFVEVSQENLKLLVKTVAACQASGLLRPGPPELVAIGLWSLVHGFVSLLLENQIPSSVLESRSLRELLVFTLNQATAKELPARPE